MFTLQLEKYCLLPPTKFYVWQTARFLDEKETALTNCSATQHRKKKKSIGNILTSTNLLFKKDHSLKKSQSFFSTQGLRSTPFIALAYCASYSLFTPCWVVNMGMTKIAPKMFVYVGTYLHRAATRDCCNFIPMTSKVMVI